VTLTLTLSLLPSRSKQFICTLNYIINFIIKNELWDFRSEELSLPGAKVPENESYRLYPTVWLWLQRLGTYIIFMPLRASASRTAPLDRSGMAASWLHNQRAKWPGHLLMWVILPRHLLLCCGKVLVLPATLCANRHIVSIRSSLVSITSGYRAAVTPAQHGVRYVHWFPSA